MLTELPSEPLRWRNYAQTPVLLSPPSHPGQRGLTALERWKWSSANLHRTGGGSCESASSELCQEFAILLQNNPTRLHTPRQTPVPSPVLLNTRKIACWMMLALLQRVCVMVQMECRFAIALRFGQGGQRRAHKSSTTQILPRASCKQNLLLFLIRLKLLNSYQQIVLATSIAISIAETILYTASQTTTWPLLTQLQKYTNSSPLQHTPLTLHATNYKLSPTI